MQSIVEFYKKYREILIPFLLLFIAFLVSVKFSYPYFNEIMDLRENVKNENEKLVSYEDSYNILSSLNEATLETQLSNVNKALPASKDVGNMYLAVLSAATKSNITLDDFSLQAGNIYDKDKNTKLVAEPVLVRIKLSNLTAVKFNNFIKQLLKEKPLSTINSISVNDSNGDVELNFYYFPYNEEKIKKEIVTPLSTNERQILEDIIF